jgi:serine/threonine protein kinase/tetratricopeptide (TPR) repeat protein
MGNMTDLRRQLEAALGDRYSIERELGRGGMAVVFLCHDRKPDRPVAVKVFRPETAAVLGVERFLREIRIAAKLTHPNILALYDCGEAGGLLYYSMPYIDGESLRDRLRRDRQLPVPDAVRIACEVADALAYAHSLGVVHRDIKPDNVLLQAGHAIVADFGIARAVWAAAGEQVTQTGLAIGTPAYMSPEQAAGDPNIDGRSDIYSLGRMLYEILAGGLPFAAPTPRATLGRTSVDEIPAISSVRKTVPPHVEQAIFRALARVPADRYATALEFSAAITGETGPAALPFGGATIAVLPFVNMSADPENEYFSDGITEEVINAVAGIPGVRVTARTSAFQFKGGEGDIREIGRKLSVGTVLEGSVRKAGNRVRVTAELINVADGYHLWSDRFDRDLEDVFAIQDEISLAIAERLKSRLAPAVLPPRTAPTAPTIERRLDPAAYDAYLRGRYHRRRMFGGGDAIQRALASYREAIEIDPGFALAYGALAEVHTVLAIGFAVQPSRELMPEAKEAAERALELDPNLAEAQLARALVAMYHEWDYAAAKAGIDRAIALNPSFVDAHFWAEFYYTYVERNFEKAVAANRRAMDLDPLDLNVSSRLAQVLIIFGRFDEAIERLEGIVRTDPLHMVSYLELADAYGRRGDDRRAMAAAERALELSSGGVVASVGLAILCAVRADNVGRARTLVGELDERARREYVFPFWLAVAHAALGDLDRAFEYLAQAERDRDPNLLYVTVAPRELGWRQDPRYPQVLRRIGLAHLVEQER